MGSRGGRRIRINAYQHINTKDMVIGVDSLDKELTNNARDGVRVWVPVYRTKVKCGQRPIQAIRDFNFSMMDRDLVEMADVAKFAVEYFASDMNLTKDKRLSSQK